MREEQLRILCALLSNPDLTASNDWRDLIELSEDIMSKIDSEYRNTGFIQDKTTE